MGDDEEIVTHARVYKEREQEYLLHPRVTTVYDTAFLVPTSRPFATWELAEAFRLPEAEVAEARVAGLIPRDETIAETRTKEGERVGSWVVSWDENGVGTCKEIGKVAR